jgi:hypothetical protein
LRDFLLAHLSPMRDRARILSEKIGNVYQRWVTLGNQLDECCEAHGQQNSHDAPKPTQNSIAIVAATGPMLTRDPMNFGTNTFVEIKMEGNR